MAESMKIRVNEVAATWDNDNRRHPQSCVHCKKKTKGRAISRSLHKTNEPVAACHSCTITHVLVQALGK